MYIRLCDLANIAKRCLINCGQGKKEYGIPLVAVIYTDEIIGKLRHSKKIVSQPYVICGALNKTM